MAHKFASSNPAETIEPSASVFVPEWPQPDILVENKQEEKQLDIDPNYALVTGLLLKSISPNMSQITLLTDCWLPCPQRPLLTIHELGLQINNVREVDISKFELKVNKSAQQSSQHSLVLIPL